MNTRDLAKVLRKSHHEEPVQRCEKFWNSYFNSISRNFLKFPYIQRKEKTFSAEVKIQVSIEGAGDYGSS